LSCIASPVAVDLRSPPTLIHTESQQSGKNSQAPAIPGGTGVAEMALSFGLTRSSPMNAPTSLDETIRRAQDILWSALPPGLARASAVIELKELLWSTQTREALALASDNYLAFALRECRMTLADASAWPDKALSALWTILDDPALNAALGSPHDFCAHASRRDHPWR
jgi:hypothetical protein